MMYLCHLKHQFGFFDETNRLRCLSSMGDQLERISHAVDFEMFRPVLDEVFKREDKGKGRKENVAFPGWREPENRREELPTCCNPWAAPPAEKAIPAAARGLPFRRSSFPHQRRVSHEEAFEKFSLKKKDDSDGG
jgi:hypothetical protein